MSHEMRTRQSLDGFCAELFAAGPAAFRMLGLAQRLRPGPAVARNIFASHYAARRTLSSVAPDEIVSRPLRLDPQLETIISGFQTSLKKGRLSSQSKSAKLVDEMGQLQRFRVQKVLLVCSDYDSYTFEEDGLLNESLWAEYTGQGLLSKPPMIDRVSSPELALERFKELGDYDMVRLQASPRCFVPRAAPGEFAVASSLGSARLAASPASSC